MVQEELGRTLTPSPMLGSAILAAQALLLSGDNDACSRLLPGVASRREHAGPVLGRCRGLEHLRRRGNRKTR